MLFRVACGLFLVFASIGVVSAAKSIKDPNEAARIGRKVCKLEPTKKDGSWHSVLNKEEGAWHVWFGMGDVEPECGFVGAIVQMDGSSASCAAIGCSVRPPPKALPLTP